MGSVLLMMLVPVAKATSTFVKPSATLTPLENQVRHELVMLPYYGVFDNLEFRVEGSKVVLSGQVVRATLRKEAENAVKKTAGIDTVENKIEILPLSSFDNQIRLAAYRAIYRNVAFSKYAIQPVPPIHIIVKNGNLTLVGSVTTDSDRNIANISARSVPNVFRVDNRLRVA